MKERLMYLDCDDTLLIHTRDVRGFPAPLAAEFVHWALEHFEVRWLTMWCPSGRLQPHGAAELAYRFDNRVTAETFLDIHNPKSFRHDKTEGVDFDDPRPWVWVEDGLAVVEYEELQRRKMNNRFFRTNVSTNCTALQATWRKLAKQFNLPGAPELPYNTEVHFPSVILSVEEFTSRFRLENSAWPH